MTIPPALEQISISLSLERNGIAPATSVSSHRCEADRETMIKDFTSRSKQPWSLSLPERFPPFHMCISHEFANHVRQVHKLLDKALIDIVERWFSDTRANFPGRVPLESHEEQLLHWMYGPGREYIRPFRDAYGIWRTDYLIERAPDGVERIKICEINARLPYNGFWVTGWLSEATKLLTRSSRAFVPLDDFERTKRAILERFNKTKPLYHLREEWHGVDSHFFLREWASVSGSQPTTIKPSQLRSREDSSSTTGRSLCYLPESKMEDATSMNSRSEQDNETIDDTVPQCSLELIQGELRDIDTDTLRQLATCSTNDFRDILLIHDKRLLCILREQLPSLVDRGVITKDEAVLLEQATIDTLIPGSPAMKGLLERSKTDETIRNRYIVKPIRDGNGQGIRLGRNITQSEWLATLKHLASRPLRPSEDACVVQSLVIHVWYDVATHYSSAREVQKCHAIGTYHLIGSELGVFGPWRLGKDVNLGVQGGTSGDYGRCFEAGWLDYCGWERRGAVIDTFVIFLA